MDRKGVKGNKSICVSISVLFPSNKFRMTIAEYTGSMECTSAIPKRGKQCRQSCSVSCANRIAGLHNYYSREGAQPESCCVQNPTHVKNYMTRENCVTREWEVSGMKPTLLHAHFNAAA